MVVRRRKELAGVCVILQDGAGARRGVGYILDMANVPFTSQVPVILANYYFGLE